MTPGGDAVLDGNLLTRIEAAVAPGAVVTTVSLGKPNRIIAISEVGIEVETEQSVAKGLEPQLVPAWMIVRAWQELVLSGRLAQTELVGRLNVKRSAFVLALFATFPDVEVESRRPSVLRLTQRD